MNITLHEMMAKIVSEYKIEKYLEIGTREGCSLKKVIVDNTNLNDIVVSDIWGTTYGGSGKGNHKHIENLVKDLNFTGNITFLDGDSKYTIPTLKSQYSNYFDLILVDGDHSYDGGMIDLENTWPLCKNGGIVVFDDITHPDHKYLETCFDKFVESKSSEIQNIHKIHYGCGIGIIYKK